VRRQWLNPQHIYMSTLCKQWTARRKHNPKIQYIHACILRTWLGFPMSVAKYALNDRDTAALARMYSCKGKRCVGHTQHAQAKRSNIHTTGNLARRPRGPLHYTWQGKMTYMKANRAATCTQSGCPQVPPHQHESCDSQPGSILSQGEADVVVRAASKRVLRGKLAVAQG
jgi:hypothetical protein